jgi:hypothetical protein
MPDLFGNRGGMDESWWYPHVWQNSRGEVVIVEAHGSDIYRLDVNGAGSVAKIGETGFQSYKLNSSINYGPDKVAIIGDDGGIYTADISNLSSAPVFTKVATLENARTNAAMISLPDGRVLIVGGTTPFGDNTDQGNGLTNAIYTPTIWDPSDNSLEQGEAQAVARLYHSSGLLLPDGSIWSGGGGAPGPQINTNVEIFQPGYFYDATGKLAERPEITDAPKNISAGETFRLTVDDSSDIDMVTAIRSGAMTHARNSDTRFVELEFTVVDATTIEVKSPNGFTMVPGAWMTFVVDKAGVPSDSTIIGVDMAPVVDTPPLENTGLQVYGIDREQINGPFELTVEARFDDLDAGPWQRVFDFGNGAGRDNIFLGQVGTSDDMRFEVWANGRPYSITATDVIVEGVRADWKVSVDAGGFMRMWKDGVLVAQGQGAVPPDVERVQNYVGDSNWINDKRLVGEVRNLEIENGNPDPDTPPRVTVASLGNAMEGAEGATGSLSFVFSLSHATTRDVTIDYDVLGSAIGPESVTILAGQRQATVTLSFTGDNIRELDELVTVDIVDVTNAKLGAKGTTSASATIADDDTPITFGDSTYRLGTAGLSWEEAQAEAQALGGKLVEINSAAENAFIQQTFGNRGNIWLGITDKAVEGAFVDGSGNAISYANWNPGEPNNLGNEDYAEMYGDTGRWNDTGNNTTNNVSVIEFDEPELPVLSIAAPADVQEGASGQTGTLSYLVSLDRASTVDVTAKVTIAGAATGPATVTIPAGQTSATIDLAFQGNDADNPDTIVTVSLSDIRNATAGAAVTASATILDDDAAVQPVISIAAPADVQEGASGQTGTLSYLVSLDRASTVDVTAKVTIAGAATGPATVTIPAGQTSATIDLAFQGNDADNPDTIVTVSLSDIRNATAGTAVTASATILDDDAAVDPTDPGPVNVVNAGDGGGYLSGTNGRDDFRGGAGKDVFNGGLGDDVYDGAGGDYNQVDFAGFAADYTYTRNTDGSVTVANAVWGTDVLRNIDGLWFSGEAKWYSLEDLLTNGPANPDPIDPNLVNVINAGDGGGFFSGTAGRDDFRGGAGRDVFNGGLGDDVYDGAGGDYNQVDFAGSAADYTFTRNTDGSVTVANAVWGTDVLRNIDGLWFSGEAKWYALQDLLTNDPTDPGDPTDPNQVNVVNTGDGGGFFSGTDGKDDFRGGAGNDVFNGGLGDDVYDGAGGDYNQVDYAGAAADYTFTRNTDGTVTVTHPTFGTDTLKNIDGLWFNGEAKWYPLDELAGRVLVGGVNIINAGDRGGYFVGTDGDDDFRGGAGNDTFVGRLGNDVYDGGSGGYDQVDLAGRLQDYSFTRNPDGSITASHAEFGVDILKNIDGLWIGEEGTWVSTSDVAPTV